MTDNQNPKTKTINPFLKEIKGETSSYVDAFVQLTGKEGGALQNVPMTEEEINALRAKQNEIKPC